MEYFVTEFKDYVVVIACFRTGQAQQVHRSRNQAYHLEESKTIMGRNKPINLERGSYYAEKPGVSPGQRLGGKTRSDPGGQPGSVRLYKWQAVLLKIAAEFKDPVAVEQPGETVRQEQQGTETRRTTWRKTRPSTAGNSMQEAKHSEWSQSSLNSRTW